MTQAFNPRHSIDQTFQLLAARLGPIIATTLATHLGGLPWTAVLEERDRIRGKIPGRYVPSDPQAQLKVLTERLGALGFPFDDQTRTVSVLGGELRISRNRWAHHDELTALDAWRTSDFAVRLLERLGDADGVVAADQIRERAFTVVAREKGIADHAVPIAGSETGAPVADATFAIPRPTLDDQSAGPSPARNSLDAETLDFYEPWPVVAVGGTDVIDELPKKAVKERVRAVASEIVDFEGPIQLKRLAQLTAASFGVIRLSEKRERKIVYQIRQVDGIHVDGDKFAWPADIDPATWLAYRPNDELTSRDFLLISPVEIANAIRATSDSHPQADRDEIDRIVLRMFGKARLTAQFRAHLDKARAATRSG